MIDGKFSCKILEFDHKTVGLAMQQVYTGTIGQLELEECKSVLAFAEKYALYGVQEYVHTYLVERHLNCENIGLIVELTCGKCERPVAITIRKYLRRYVASNEYEAKVCKPKLREL